MHGRCTRLALPNRYRYLDSCWLNFWGKQNWKENEKNIVMLLLNAQARARMLFRESKEQGSNFESWIE